MVLSNPKHELFATYVASGLNQTESGRRIGISEGSVTVESSRLAKRPEVKGRIVELRNLNGMESKDAPVNKLWIITKLVEIVESKEKGDPSKIKALELLSRLGGFLVDRSESYSERVNLTLEDPKELQHAILREVGALPFEEREAILSIAPIDLDDLDVTACK